VAEGGIWSVALSRDGTTMAAGYRRADGVGGVILWDLATRQRLVDAPLLAGECHVWSVALSHDGKTIAAGFGRIGLGVQGGGVVLWDGATRQRLVDAPLPVAEGPVWSVAFSHDGKTIAAGFDSGKVGGVVLWDSATRQRLIDAPLPVAEGGVCSVALSDGGKTIAAAYRGYIFADGVSGDDGVVLWDADLESWQRRAGQIANRNFTRTEWRDYFPDVPYRATFPDLPVPPEVTSRQAASTTNR
jgi:WD40 repeat protein